jgi:hypothetical protein
MASSVINSDDGVISGTSGLKSSGGDDGNLVFQSKGTETARINTDKQIVAAAGTASLPALTTTGDLNTGIFFSAADTIDFVEGGTACGQFDSSANFKFNSGYGSVATAYGCRAWVNFDGTGTPAIRASGNVTSITDNGTGDYTVNFTTAMPDANYSVVTTSTIQAGVSNAGVVSSVRNTGGTTPTQNAGDVRIVTIGVSASTEADVCQVTCSVFR